MDEAKDVGREALREKIAREHFYQWFKRERAYYAEFTSRDGAWDGFAGNDNKNVAYEAADAILALLPAPSRDEDAARIKALEEALEWALAEIDGRTKYTDSTQFAACFERARAARIPTNV